MRTFILFLYIVAGVTGQGFSTTFLQNTLFGGDHSDFGVSSWSDQTRGVRYLVGQTYSSEFSGTPLSGKTLGAPDILLVKLDQATDSLLWYVVVGTSRSDQPRAITGDSEGNIWITGQTFGTFDNTDSTGVSKGFVMKLDSNGKTLQSMTIDTFQPAAIDSDLNGNIWIAGSATTSQSSDDNSNDDVAVIILSSVTGEQLSTQTFGGSASDIAKTIAVDKNTVAIGGVTYSSDFPVTKGTRECEFCNGAGFVMTLTYDSNNGIQQSFSTYIIGDESQSLSVVDITFDSNNNMYLAMFDDSNAMGAYIQQYKSDRSLGWVSEKSDAFWKVDYLPLIDAVYTIGSFSTPSDYATFFVLDTKSGATVYSSKALTGALVDASAYAVDETTVKISMVGTLQKDLRISYHGRTYLTTHKSDDMLIVSLNIRTLAAKTSQSKLSSKVSDKTSVSARSVEARGEAAYCLINRPNGFGLFNDFIFQTYSLDDYELTFGPSSVLLPYEDGHDYDSSATHATLVSYDFANAGRPARRAAGVWGAKFEAFLQFSLGATLPDTQYDRNGFSYIELSIPSTESGKIVIYNNGRSKTGDQVSWTVQVVLPAFGTEAEQDLEVTLSPMTTAPLYLWVSFDGTAASDHFAVYASTTSTKPTSTILSFTLTADRLTSWSTSVDFYPKIASGSTTKTYLAAATICGFQTKITEVPISLAKLLPTTGQTNFPPDTATGYAQAWVGQVIVLEEDSVDHTQTKFQLYKADGTTFQPGFSTAFVYTVPYDHPPAKLKKVYGSSGFVASAGISGTGLLAGFVFPSQIKFTAGTPYYFYISDGLTSQDDLLVSHSAKRDFAHPMLIWDNNQQQYVEDYNTNIVISITSKPFANSDPLEANDPALPPGTSNPNSDTSDACTPGSEGCIVEDPVFVGYNNQKFLFKGTAGQTYNLYNDPWVNINSEFGYANEKKKTGTVLHTIGVSIGQHNLFFDITNRENRRFFDVIIDGVTTRVGYNSQHLSGCVDLQYNTKVLLITTPRHSIRLTIEWGHNWHINVPYFDLAIHHPEEDATKIGGLLGQTAHEFKRDDVDMVEDDFKVTSIFSFEKSKFYNLQSIDC